MFDTRRFLTTSQHPLLKVGLALSPAAAVRSWACSTSGEVRVT